VVCRREYAFRAEGTTKKRRMSMKKTVIVLLALLLPASLWAMDIDQGKFELSGKTAFNFSDTTTEVDGAAGDIDQTTWSIEVDGNYYLARNLGLGLIFQYESTEIEVGSIDADASTVFIGPQIIYHFPLSDKVSLFVNGAVGYAALEVENEDADGWGFKVGGGLKYFLTHSISMNGSVNYQWLTMEADAGGDADTDGISVGAGLSLYF
jgi:hypothetical protein